MSLDTFHTCICVSYQQRYWLNSGVCSNAMQHRTLLQRSLVQDEQDRIEDENTIRESVTADVVQCSKSGAHRCRILLKAHDEAVILEALYRLLNPLKKPVPLLNL